MSRVHGLVSIRFKSSFNRVTRIIIIDKVRILSVVSLDEVMKHKIKFV